MKSIIIALACIFLLPSCATLFSKSVYPINIDSTPQGKSFKIINREGLEVMQGITPQIVPLKSSSRYFTSEYYTVLFQTDSGKEVRMPITFHVDGWYIAGNFFFPGLIGYLLVDPITGAMYTADQRFVRANLYEGTAHNDVPQLRIMELTDFEGDLSQLTEIKISE